MSKGDRKLAKLVSKQVEKKNGWLEWLENRRWILPAVFSIIIFVMAIWGIGNFNQLLLYDDEFGYWAASAYMTGTDWTSVTSGIPYYSYGYGFLILTPIRLIFSNPETMYQAAIVVNALLLVGSYWIARNITKQLFKEAHWALIDTVCFVVMLYPSNIVFSHIAWAECLLVFMFWVFAWVLLRVVVRPTYINVSGWAVTIMLLYVIHQRTLAIVIASCMLAIYMFIVNKKCRKQMMVFFVLLVFLFLIHNYIKNDLVSLYYHNNTKISINNFEGQFSNILKIFTAQGFGKIFFSAMGKWLYLTLATGFVIWWSLSDLFKNFISLFYKNKKEKKKHSVEINEYTIWKATMLFAFIGTFMISAIFLIEINRNDTLIYGRYIEFMIGLFIVIGFFSLLEKGISFKNFMTILVTTLMMTWMCQIVLDEANVTGYQAYHSIFSSLIFEAGKSVEGRVYQFAAWALAAITAWQFFFQYKFEEKEKLVRNVILVLIPCVVWSTVSCSFVMGRMTDKQILRVTNIRTIVNWIDKIDESEKIYYLSDTESRYWSESFQFLLGERPLEVIPSSAIEYDEDAYYITGDGFVDSTGFEENYYCIKRTNQFALVVRADGELAQKAVAIKN